MHAFATLQCILKELTLFVVDKLSSSKRMECSKSMDKRIFIVISNLLERIDCK